MHVQYDPQIIHAHAAALYSRAARIVFTTGVLGFIVGAIAGSLLGATTEGRSGVFTLVGGLVGALIGVSIGRGRAFVLQLQAQSALCQVAIEANTRRAADAADAAGIPSSANRMSSIG
ncbi:hypothetical protein [Myxococcus sp. Y35]|uniref:hypothetical protein n=1 Tax=Pseudomyxococcus flavus TaxID=3115648 RepID=UPI003CF09A9E